MSKKLKSVLGAIIGLIYASSLAFECYLVDGQASIGSFGLIAFLLGWLNFNILGLTWLANPLFIASLIIFFVSKKVKLALILSLIAFCLAISFTQINEIIKNEAGHTGQITGYLTGYWLWISAIFVLLVSLVMHEILPKKRYTTSNK